MSCNYIGSGYILMLSSHEINESPDANPNHSIFHDYVSMQKIAANLNLSFSTKSVLKSQINSLATKHKITVFILLC